MEAQLTNEEVKACEILGINKTDFLKAIQRGIDSLPPMEKKYANNLVLIRAST